MTLSSEIRLKVLNKTDGHCFYCNRKLGANFHIDHFISQWRWKDWGLDDPLGSVNQLTNLFPACPKCNMKKGAQDPEDFMGNSFTAWDRSTRTNIRSGLEPITAKESMRDSYRFKGYVPVGNETASESVDWEELYKIFS